MDEAGGGGYAEAPAPGGRGPRRCHQRLAGRLPRRDGAPRARRLCVPLKGSPRLFTRRRPPQWGCGRPYGDHCR